MSKRTYEVFARQKRVEPLVHIGTVRAVNEDFARVYARQTYDEENWIEMVLVPRDTMIAAQSLEPLIDPNS